MEDLDNKWILSTTTDTQDCKAKDGNNPVTLGLENMRGVSFKRQNDNFWHYVNRCSFSLERELSEELV